MTTDATAGKVNDQVTPSPDVALPTVDRMPAGKDNTFVAQDTSAQHLPQMDIDTPYNPLKIPGTYDPKAIEFAKKSGFSADEMHVLEEGGPDRFNQSMAWLQQRPDQIPTVKAFADGVGYYQTHPDVPMNPAKIPGEYDPKDIQFAKTQGFNPDQIHVLEQWGADNFKFIAQDMQKDPSKVQAYKDFANVIGYWETHPDMPPAGAAHVPYNPDAVKFAQSSGFNPSQIAVLQQFGGDNFNNTMTYLSKNPDKVKNFQDLANGVGYFEMQAAQRLQGKK